MIDLGGFEVKGPNTCAGYPVTSCAIPGGAAGIVAATQTEFLTVVRNGNVNGMSGSCIDLRGNSSTVENVAVFFCGSAGIIVGLGGRVSQSFSSNNLFAGIIFGDAGIVEGNESRGNGKEGILNSSTNILGASAIGNRVTRNTLSGIALGRGLLSRNIVAGNTGGSFFGGATSLGDNLCDGALC